MEATKKKPHVLLVPHPAQGHVFPTLKLAHKLAEHGISVTVANLDYIHLKIKPEEEQQQQGHGGVRLVSLADGSGSDIKDVMTFRETAQKVVPVQVRELLIRQKSLRNDDEQEFSWVIADAFTFGVFVVAKEMGIKTAALWTASMENFAFILRIPQLIEAGTIDENGFLVNKELPVSISEEILAWKDNELPWSCQPEELQSFLFKHYYMKPSEHRSLFDHVIVNSFHELEPSAFQLFPDFLPIGPLVTNSTSGSFWRQDETCLTWLDKHPPKSVIYVAFGSIAAMNQQQFHELALGLELTGRPFLWVIRTNFVQRQPGQSSGMEFPNGYLERVSDRGKIVEWTNQEQVLSHPSIGCFLSHCGWNSILDGLWCGVPFLCWPYFVDQFHNKEAICEAWKVGLKLEVEDDEMGGLITMSQIADKVEQLFSDETIKSNLMRLRGLARASVNKDGISFRNFLSFVDNLCS